MIPITEKVIVMPAVKVIERVKFIWLLSRDRVVAKESIKISI